MIAGVFECRPGERAGDTAPAQGRRHLSVIQRDPAGLIDLKFKVRGFSVFFELKFTHCGSQKLGVEWAISTSSALMSAETSANSGVLRYRSPVSGSMQRIVDPLRS